MVAELSSTATSLVQVRDNGIKFWGRDAAAGRHRGQPRTTSGTCWSLTPPPRQRQRDHTVKVMSTLQEVATAIPRPGG
ncbi:MAG: hypothetical protein U0797_24250 [Gemmataceae bacterium]